MSLRDEIEATPDEISARLAELAPLDANDAYKKRIELQVSALEQNKPRAVVSFIGRVLALHAPGGAADHGDGGDVFKVLCIFAKGVLDASPSVNLEETTVAEETVTPALPHALGEAANALMDQYPGYVVTVETESAWRERAAQLGEVAS
jgi:hypothetical protein